MSGKNVSTVNGPPVPSTVARQQKEQLPADLCQKIHRLMVRSRAVEERMIKMSKSGEGYFWIGGPGEEAFNVCFGLNVKKGEGPDFDYLHLHYRNSGLMIAMGMSMEDCIRQMAMRKTDRNSMGRNFPGHFAVREWNVVPVSSVIEIQMTMAPGTAHVQKRHGGDGLTAAFSGDAGTAEGDFASCLVWSTRPGNELPVLIVVMNNSWGISTPYDSQHAEKHIIERGKAFGIPGEVVDGNDPIASWFAVRRAMQHCRTKRRPFMLEANVSRLYGHSSSSGALLVPDEEDCIARFEQHLLERKIATSQQLEDVHADAKQEADDAVETVMQEGEPDASDVERYTYAPSDVDAVYPDDYTGLPK